MSRPPRAGRWEGCGLHIGEKCAGITRRHNVEAMLLQKPLAMRPLISHPRRPLQTHRGCGTTSSDSEVKSAGSNPHQSCGPSSIHRPHCPMGIKFLITKSKSLSLTCLSGHGYIYMTLDLIPSSYISLLKLLFSVSPQDCDQYYYLRVIIY